MQQSSTQGAQITQSQFDALLMQRSELQEQLRTLTRRRNELQAQRSGMSSARGADHDARIKEIDARSAQVDHDILRLDAAIADAQGQPRLADQLLGRTGQPSTSALIDQAIRDATRNASRDSARSAAGMSIVALVAVVVLWRGARRFFKPARPADVVAVDRRLEQLQQAVDVIALEVERMSESQRYVAKVLSEKYPALGAGAAQPVAIKAKEPASSANRG